MGVSTADSADNSKLVRTVVSPTLQPSGEEFERLLSFAVSPENAPRSLSEAMHAAVLEGGKRFRPLLVRRSCQLFGAPAAAALRVGCVVELLHAASLVLDDLPAFDDDDHRRNRPSIHKRFGQARAILTAMALVARAFELLSDAEVSPDPLVRTRLVSRCAAAIGAEGMTGGQALDMADQDEAARKTADLIAFCCEAGPIMARADPELQQAMRAYGNCLGRLFQHRDDHLDEGKAGSTLARAADLAEGRRIATAMQADFGYDTSELITFLEWATARPA
jgi:farnesyl diphosphate synthase